MTNLNIFCALTRKENGQVQQRRSTVAGTRIRSFNVFVHIRNFAVSSNMAFNAYVLTASIVSKRVYDCVF